MIIIKLILRNDYLTPLLFVIDYNPMQYTALHMSQIIGAHRFVPSASTDRNLIQAGA
jgi:hypothetical protein